MSALVRCRLLVLSASLLLVGCVERSTVVKVNKDGTGIVHVRNHVQEVSLVIGGNEVAGDESESPLPSPEQLEALAASMGSGVKLKSAEVTENRSGWRGYELVFEFSDINQLVLGDELLDFDDDDEDDAEDASDAAAKSQKPAKPPQEYRFALRDGRLEIRSTGFDRQSGGNAASTKSGAVDPFADQPPAAKTRFDLNQAAMTEIYAKVLADMRIGVFVQVDGEIESTNARHEKNNLITLVSVNVGQMLENPEAAKQLKSLEALKDSANFREKSQQLADEIDGIDIDTQDPIVVQFR